ncbi:MAG: alpha/beta fold hydrolase [Pseudomonadota bacterium]
MPRLAQTVYGMQGRLPPLVIAHGLFGSGRNWRAIARALGRDRAVVTVDMRNHGASFHDADHSYAAMADDLARTVAEIGCEVDLLGHSMGGKAAMALALTAPDCLRRLIVADIAPVAYGHSHAGHIAAMRALALDRLSSRAEADAALDHAGIADAPTRAFLLQNLMLAETPRRWLLNLDALEQAMPQLVGWPALSGLFDGPALFLSGAMSDYVLSDHRPKIQALFPQARFEAIADAGHWLHAQQPRAVIAAIDGFLSA